MTEVESELPADAEEQPRTALRLAVGAVGLAALVVLGRYAGAYIPQFAGWVEAGPDLEKDGVVRWRCADLRRRIETEFGVELHERTVGKHLAALGYRRLSVRPQHPKADPEA